MFWFFLSSIDTTRSLVQTLMMMMWSLSTKARMKRAASKFVFLYLSTTPLNDCSQDEESGLSGIDLKCTKTHTELEAKYGNSSDKILWYTCSVTVESIIITPMMANEWIDVILDGLTTVDEPPNTLPFDPAKRRSSVSDMFPPHN